MSEVQLHDLLDQVKDLQARNDRQQMVRLCFLGLSRFGDRVGLLEPLAETFFHAGDLDRTSDYLRRLCGLEPDVSARWAQLGAVLASREENRAAADAMARAYELDTGNVAAGVNFGITLVKLQDHARAVQILSGVTADFPEEMTAWLWLGHALIALDRLEDGAAAYERLLGEEAYIDHALMPLSVAWRGLGKLDEANGYLRQLLARDPDHSMARFALAQNQLMAGDFAQGFSSYEARWNRPGNSRADLPSRLWRGEELGGRRILVLDEQGFGDCIQFSRFLPRLKQLGGEVLFKVRPRLRRLLSHSLDVDHWVGDGEDAEADFHIPLLSLPLHLGVRPEGLGADPYLAAEPALAVKWRDRLAGISGSGGNRSMKIGVVWQGDPGSQSEQGRSVPFEALLPLFSGMDADFFLLQKMHGRSALAGMDMPDNVHDLGDMLDLGEDAFIDTAAVMCALDLMISSDTAPAHLAGALGVRTAVMLKRVPEWRWMLGRNDSPWYRTVTLFRQQERGKWDHVVKGLLRHGIEAAGI